MSESCVTSPDSSSGPLENRSSHRATSGAASSSSTATSSSSSSASLDPVSQTPHVTASTTGPATDSSHLSDQVGGAVFAHQAEEGQDGEVRGSGDPMGQKETSSSESKGQKRKSGHGLQAADAAVVCSSSSASAPSAPSSSSSSSKASSPTSSDTRPQAVGHRRHRHHHRSRRSSLSPTSVKKTRSGSLGGNSSSEKGSNHNSSDSEDENKMMIDEDAGHEDEVPVVSPPASTTGQAVGESSKPGSPDASSPKVPPLRIVISKPNASPVTNGDSSHSFSQRVTSSTSSSCAPSSSSSSSVVSKSVPHLIVSSSVTPSASSSTHILRSEDQDAGASDDEASNASGASGPTNTDSRSGTTSGRVTRSSQRVKEQHHQQHQDPHTTRSHHNLRDRGRDKDTDESDSQVTSPTSTCSKDTRDDVTAGAKADALTRKRKVGRTKGSSSITGSSATPEKVTRSSEKNVRESSRGRDTLSVEANADEDNESTSSSTSSTSGSKESAGTSVSDAVSAGLLKSKEFSVPSYNSYQMYLNIRKAIGKRRKNLMPVQPNPPKGFKDYLMIRGGYLLKDSISSSLTLNSPASASARIPGLASPPADLSPGSALYNLFLAQERERHRLRIQHTIEKEKLRLSYEQEILRVHGRAALAVSNQTVPYSFCSIIKDDEIYNMIEQENEETAVDASEGMGKAEAESRPSSGSSGGKGNEYSKNTYTSSSTTSADITALTGGPSAPGSRSRYNGRLFLSWIQDVTDKWEKIKTDTILRQRRESESLLAIQKLDWEWKMKELLLCDFKTTPLIDRKLIPSVDVCDDFDLLSQASAV